MRPAHTTIRRHFGLMPGLVRSVATDDVKRAAFVADHVVLVCGLVRRHHAGEDKCIWPPLRQRCPEECTPLLDLMEKQHNVIHERVQQIETAQQEWRHAASAQARDGLAGAIERFLPVAIEHLALEEEGVVPLIEKYVTQSEYARVAQEHAADIPPDKLPTLFGMFMYEADPAIVDRVVAEMPAEVQPVIRSVGATAYANYVQQLYGTTYALSDEG
jgi:hemerythrin-like domain-containing protein